MATNDEIREQESLTSDEQVDRERSLMAQARADERAKVQKEMLNGNLEVKSGTKLVDFLPQKEIRKLSEIVQKEIIKPSLNKVRTEAYNEGQKDTANQIFKELEKYTTSYGNILLSKAELQTLKKQFKVD
jgi:hypothetical protein